MHATTPQESRVLRHIVDASTQALAGLRRDLLQPVARQAADERATDPIVKMLNAPIRDRFRLIALLSCYLHLLGVVTRQGR